MNYYETLYIIHPALEAGRLKDIIMGVEDSLKKTGAAPLAIELWGKRKLAYFIDKQKYGTYVLVQYNGKGKCTHDFAVELEHNPNILAYLTTNINLDDVIEQAEDLETQIAGKTREAEKTTSRFEQGGDKKSSAPVAKTQKGDSTEIINEEGSHSEVEKQKQISNTDENIKDDENKSVDLPNEQNDDKKMDIAAEPITIDENKSNKKKSSEETALKSNKENADEPAAINEEE